MLWVLEFVFCDWLIDLLAYLLIYLFIYFWLCWVFVSVRGLSLVVASGGHSSSRCAGLSLSQPLLLRSTGSRHTGSVVVAHGPSCSAACGIFPNQGSNPCPLYWQADSQPLRHQGSPVFCEFFLTPPILSAIVLPLGKCFGGDKHRKPSSTQAPLPTVPVLSSTGSRSPMWLFKFKLTTTTKNLKSSSSVTPATFKCSTATRVATERDTAKHRAQLTCHHDKKFTGSTGLEDSV